MDTILCRSVTKILTVFLDLENIVFFLTSDSALVEIHSFPTMYSTWGEMSQNNDFLQKNAFKTAF